MTGTTYTLTSDACLFHADCRDALRALPDNSIDSVVTDPPYALVSIVKRFGGPNAAPAKGNDAYMRASAGFMQKSWDTGEVAFDPAFWAEVLRVLKPGGHLVAMGGTRTYHRLACAVEDAGFEIRDMIAYLYGTGFPKGQDVPRFIDRELGVESVATGTKVYAGGHVQNSSANKLAPPIGTFVRSQDERLEYEYVSPQARAFAGFSTALKPAIEPTVLARKPLSEGTVAANVLRWGTGALNIDATRIPGDIPTSFPKRRTPKGDYVYEAGFHKTAEETAEASPLGRWPANVVLSFPEDTFTVRHDCDSTQRAELESWLAANT